MYMRKTRRLTIPKLASATTDEREQGVAERTEVGLVIEMLTKLE
jgi:hypothetical protein